MIIVVDFDNTLYDESTWPEIGNLLPFAKETICKLDQQGHCIIINTCREGVLADDAKAALIRDGIPFKHFNENCRLRVAAYGGHDVRKIAGDVFIDDRGVYAQKYGINWKEIYDIIQTMPPLTGCRCKA